MLHPALGPLTSTYAHPRRSGDIKSPLGHQLPHIQAWLGHESITTTIDTYGHLLPVGDELISEIIATALRGQQIRPASVMRLIAGSQA